MSKEILLDMIYDYVPFKVANVFLKIFNAVVKDRANATDTSEMDELGFFDRVSYITKVLFDNS